MKVEKGELITRDKYLFFSKGNLSFEELKELNEKINPIFSKIQNLIGQSCAGKCKWETLVRSGLETLILGRSVWSAYINNMHTCRRYHLYNSFGYRVKTMEQSLYEMRVQGTQMNISVKKDCVIFLPDHMVNMVS